MQIESLEHWLIYCGLDQASFSEGADGELIIHTGCKNVLHVYTDMTGELRSYETLEPLDYQEESS